VHGGIIYVTYAFQAATRVSDGSYHEEIQRLRENRNREMTASPLNWLSLVGLFCFEEGDSSFGGDDANKIVIRQMVHQRGGVFRFEDGRVVLTSVEDGSLRVNGRLPDSRPLRADLDGDPDLVETGSVAMRVIRRGQRTLLRVWDKEAPAVRHYTGLRYYPIRPEYRMMARFVPYSPPRVLAVLDAIGNEYARQFIGQAQFLWNGVECHLEAEDAGDKLLFNFTDETRTDATYPGGRFLTVPKFEGGQVTLDFNRACNWPCAYTSFAACPIPPIENRLAVRIEAGEMRYHP
jgi:uncharacterized protein (DUF1684 family)